MMVCIGLLHRQVQELERLLKECFADQKQIELHNALETRCMKYGRDCERMRRNSWLAAFVPSAMLSGRKPPNAKKVA